jgi:signal transduction histidine kinase
VRRAKAAGEEAAGMVAAGAESLMDTWASGQMAEERAALRRVAELVARGKLPEEIFAAVTAEVGRLLGADSTAMARYDQDKTITYVARWSAVGDDLGDSLQSPLGQQSVITVVFETGQPARIDDICQPPGLAGERDRRLGVSAAVGAPISVEGRPWGVILVASMKKRSFPADTEERLAAFTELAGTAIASAQARLELRGYAQEQAALRRVATLVAGGAPPEEVFAAVAAEAGQLVDADLTGIGRFDPGDVMTVVGAWSSAGIAIPHSVGTRTSLGGQNIATMVFHGNRPVRIDGYRGATGAVANLGREWGFRAAAGAPIAVGGRLWGVMTIASTSQKMLPAGTEERLAAFTELVGTAIANAEAQSALAASRARILTTADETRRRIERDLHDGAQQHLVTLALQLRELQATAAPEARELVHGLDHVSAGLDAALAELREIARGIHPAVLTNGGLRPALKALARRCTVPIALHVQVGGRPPAPVEIAAYYVVAEALTNIAKHARASAASVDLTADEGVLRVCVRDDGRGGADFSRSSGLVGLKDRIEALGGQISLHSPPSEGTTLSVYLPLGGPPARS